MFFGAQALKIFPEKLIERLEQVELHMLGDPGLTEDRFQTMNEELSVCSVLYVGERKFRRHRNEKHLIWITPDREEHDLGPITRLNVTRDYPGFHYLRTLAMGQDKVCDHEKITLPSTGLTINSVMMDDGSVGVGSTYRLALRNAALKKRLREITSRPSRLRADEGLGIYSA